MKKILILDDNNRVKSVMGGKLQEEGFLVRHASNPLQAFNILFHEQIYIVLLDIRMAEINGNALQEVIQDINPETLIVYISVYENGRGQDRLSRMAPEFEAPQRSAELMVNNRVF